MRPASILAALALSFCAATVAHATVAVHGMNHDPIGAASLAVSGDAASGYQLIVSNIGSSGNDGVSIALPSTNGLSYVYGTPPPPSSGGTLPATIYVDMQMLRGSGLDVMGRFTQQLGLSGTGVDLAFDLPGSPEAVVELFNGLILVYSSRKSYASYQARGSIHLDGPSVTVAEPGVGVAFRFGRPAINTAISTPFLISGCSVEMTRPTPWEVTIEGVTYVADRVKVKLPWIRSSERLRCAQAVLTVACEDDGLGGTGDMAISTNGAPATPVKHKAYSQGLTVAAVSGATLADAGGTGDLQRIRVIPDTDPSADACVVSLWGLPPGVPVLSRTLEATNLRFHSPTFEMPTGQSLTFKATPVAGIAGGVIAAIVIAKVIATCTAEGPTSFAWSASSENSTQGFHYELYRGPRQTTSLDGTYTPRSSNKPRSHSLDCPSGHSQMGFGFPPGNTITAGGVVYDADSIVVVFDPTPDPVIGFVSEDLLPSPGTQFTLLSTEGTEYGKFRDDGGKVTICHGTARMVPMADGTVTVTNIGSSGNDGVSFYTNGLPSVQIPFTNGLALADGEGFRLDADPCFEGECEPTYSLRVGPKRLVSSKFVVRSTMPPGSPLVIEAGGVIAPYLDSDSDDDGEIEIGIPPGLSGDIASIGYSQLSPYREAACLTFTTMVTLKRLGGDQVIPAGHSICIWRNIDGAPIGAPAPTARVISLNGLPPGQPYVRSIEGVGLDRVMLSGTGSDASLANNNIDGFPVIPTWAAVSGPGEPLDPDDDGDGYPDLFHSYATDSVGGLPIRVRGINAPNVSSVRRNGYVMHADFDLMPTAPDGAIIGIAVGATVGGLSYAKGASIEISASPGGTRSIAYDHVLIATSVECDVYLGSTFVRSFPYVGDIDCDQLPITLALHTPLDSVGGLYGECRFRAPAVLSSGEIVVACDRLVFRPSSDVQLVVVTSCDIELHGLPPGETLENFRLGEIVPESVILAAPGDGAAVAPTQFALSRAYPNPMRATSTVRFAVPARQHVRAVVMDVAGRQVARLAEQEFEAGEHTLRWTGMGEGGAPVPAGLYFVRVESAGKSKVTRLTRLQ